MTAPASAHIPPEIVQLLDDSGVPWAAEHCRSRIRLRIAGRVCQTFPMRGGRLDPGRFGRNALAAVKRAVRELR